jgi:hypothetical protein
MRKALRVSSSGSPGPTPTPNKQPEVTVDEAVFKP